MAMSQSVGELIAALGAAQAEFPSVKKDRQGYGYKYADLSSCLEAVREPLSKNGLSIVQFPSSIDGKQFLVTHLMHTSGEYITGEYIMETDVLAKMNSCQAMGSALTYARRYSLAAMVGLTLEDDDGASTSTRPKQMPTDSQKVVSLCKAARISPKEFAEFFDISSEDIETVKNAVANFDDMAAQFLESKNANPQTVN